MTIHDLRKQSHGINWRFWFSSTPSMGKKRGLGLNEGLFPMWHFRWRGALPGKVGKSGKLCAKGATRQVGPAGPAYTPRMSQVIGEVPFPVNLVYVILFVVQSLIFPLVSFGGLALIIRTKRKTAASRKAAVAWNEPLWRSARRIWNELYLCPRHAGIYLPPARASGPLFYPGGTPVPEGMLVPRWQIRAFCRFP